MAHVHWLWCTASARLLSTTKFLGGSPNHRCVVPCARWWLAGSPWRVAWGCYLAVPSLHRLLWRLLARCDILSRRGCQSIRGCTVWACVSRIAALARARSGPRQSVGSDCGVPSQRVLSVATPEVVGSLQITGLLCQCQLNPVIAIGASARGHTPTRPPATCHTARWASTCTSAASICVHSGAIFANKLVRVERRLTEGGRC